MRAGVLAYTTKELAKVKRPGKKAFQKIVYFMQEAGVPLGFRYSIHLFGPYSEALDTYVETQVFEGTLAFEQDGLSTLVKPGPSCDTAIEEDKEEVSKYRSTIDAVIQKLGRKTPFTLEVLSTTHFVAVHMPGPDEEVIKATYSLKDGKFSEQEISRALTDLRELGFLPTR